MFQTKKVKVFVVKTVDQRKERFSGAAKSLAHQTWKENRLDTEEAKLKDTIHINEEETGDAKKKKMLPSTVYKTWLQK